MDTDTVQVRVADHIDPQDKQQTEQKKQQPLIVREVAPEVRDAAWRRGNEVLQWRQH